MSELLRYGLLGGAFFLLSAGLTGVLRPMAIKLGFHTNPSKSKETRWNSRMVALGGGVAITLSLTAGFFWLGGPSLVWLFPALFAVFLLGLIDDYWGIPPIGKLVVQFIAATVLVSRGYALSTEWPVVGMVITIIWIVGVTNALNLIDNMDGLASGVTVIAFLGFAFLFSQSGNEPNALISVIAAGAVAGFLVHNYYPARIFMGDAGSLPLGFLLAALSTQLHITGEAPKELSFIPAFFLLVVPLFDTALVTVARRNANRPVMSGGRDHSSHRLVALGMSEPRAVFLLYLLGLGGFVFSHFMINGTAWELMGITLIGCIILTLFAMFLLEIPVYTADPNTKRHLNYGENYLPLTLRYVVEIALDIGLIALAWTLAHFVRFQDQGLVTHYKFITVVPTLPYVIAVKLTAFAFFRLYRGLWQTVLSYDVYRFFKAACLGTLLLVAVLAFKNRLQDLSRAVILLDGTLTFLGLLGTRAAMSGFRRWFRTFAVSPYNAALFGPTMLVEPVKEAVHQQKRMRFVGVILPKSEQREADGEQAETPILGNYEHLKDIVDKNRIDVIYYAHAKEESWLFPLSQQGVSIRQLRIQLN